MTGQRGRFLIGMVAGLLLGLALALAVALYITKTPIPFINKVPQRTAEQDAAEAVRNKNWDPNAPLAGKTPARLASQAASGVVDGAASEPTAAPTAAPASSASAARGPAALVSGQATPAAAPKSTAAALDPFNYFVQAGAFGRTEDAEQQRAKLAMLGVGAKVMEREQSGRMVYRVRIGPFDSRDEAEAVQSRLQAASVEANLVRVER